MMPPPSNPRRDLRAPLGILVLRHLGGVDVYYLTIGSWTPEATPDAGAATGLRRLESVAPPSTPPAARQSARPCARRRARDVAPERAIPATHRDGAAGEIIRGRDVAMLQPGRPPFRRRPGRRSAAAPKPSSAARSGRDRAAHAARRAIHRGRRSGRPPASCSNVPPKPTTPTPRWRWRPPTIPPCCRSSAWWGWARDLEKARTWYQKAESLGSADAARRLRALANR